MMGIFEDGVAWLGLLVLVISLGIYFDHKRTSKEAQNGSGDHPLGRG